MSSTWEASFINSPSRLFVAPGGETVVTMDLWCSTGRDPRVFYGHQGKLLKRYDRAEGVLIAADESKNVIRSVSSFWWNKDAHAQFTADGEFFWVWLPWRRLMVFDSKHGNAVDTKAMSFDSTVVLKTAELMAKSVDASDRTAAARLAGWYRFGESVSILQKLLVDPYYMYTGEQAAAKDAPGYTGMPVLFY
jgi:hypothetical protein